jgi:2-polyprenyl-3-methyl-5-hydroxy-6-metoxy-1,4-benzoquinol methylase
MKSQIYDQAKYYEIAFSFIDAKKQGELFEQFAKKYSKIKVKTILDLGCGTALQLREMAKRGYKVIGLDASSQMLKYLNQKALSEGLKIETIKANMNKFNLKQQVDFVYIMMGSIIYVGNNNSFLSHLNSVSDSLKSGGLYLIENIPMNWADPKFLKAQTWTMKKNGIKIKTTYKLTAKDTYRQIVSQDFVLDVDDSGVKRKYIDHDELKIIFPEELKLLVEKSGKFEFIGFFERYSIKKLKGISSENIALLRKI